MVLILPGIRAPSDAPTFDISTLRPASERLGGVRLLLDQLTGAYTLAELMTIQRVYQLLHTATVLQNSDVVTFKLGNEADSRINWIGGPPAESHGATFGDDGFSLDGIDDYIDIKADLTGNGHYKVANAHMGAYLTRDGGTASARLIGTIGSAGTPTHLSPRNSASFSAFRLNSSATTSVPLVRGNLRGLWSVGNLSTEMRSYLFFGEDSVASGTPSFTGLPGALAIGRNVNAYSDLSVSGWFAGAYLSSQRRAALNRAFEIMNATFVSAG